MFIPLLLIIPALLFAAVIAYGTHPSLGQFAHGIDIILWSRRLLWLLISVDLLLCVALILLVISGKKRVWWLIALFPILALFSHRFITGPKMPEVVEDPTFVSVPDAKFLKDTDQIIGVKFGDVNCAFPYMMLFDSPAVVVSDREKRMIVLSSPFANRVLAFNITRDVKASDLEIISSPANAVLIYDHRLGEFYNSVTGETQKHALPKGFKEPLVTAKMTWADWRNKYPESRVMMRTDHRWENNPREPVLPNYPMPKNRPELADVHRVCLIASTQPIAISATDIREAPVNLPSVYTPAVVFRDAGDHAIRAFNRRIFDDLTLRFTTAADPKRPEIKLMDVDTGTFWSIRGTAIDGPKETKGKRLTALPVDEDVYWGIAKFWYPDLQEIDSKTLSTMVASPPAAVKEKPATESPRRKKRKPVQ